MRGPLAVALAVFLALAPVVVAVPVGHSSGHPVQNAPGMPGTGTPGTTTASPSPVVPEANTTEYLSLPSDDIQTEGFGTTATDVSGALAVDADRLEAAFTRRWFSESYAAADSDAERRLVLRLAADRVVDRVDRLHDRERDALEAFNAREISAREYLRELAVVDARAEALQGVVRDLQSTVERVEDPPITGRRLNRLQARLASFQGPVRDRVGRTLAGEHDAPLRVYVETSSDGVVLAAIVETDGTLQYVREAFLPPRRDADGPDQFEGDTLEALERFSELYPWTWEHAGSTSIGTPDLISAGVYRVTAVHTQGRLTAYLDGRTNTTFLEYQRNNLSRIPTNAPVTNAANGLRLQVNRTRVGGPLEVRVLDVSTGEPVDARITVDDVPLGRTGADGRIWTIAPPARFTVSATDAGNRVSVDTFSRRNS